MSSIRKHLKAGLDRARIARYHSAVTADARIGRRAVERTEQVKGGARLYI